MCIPPIGPAIAAMSPLMKGVAALTAVSGAVETASTVIAQQAQYESDLRNQELTEAQYEAEAKMKANEANLSYERINDQVVEANEKAAEEKGKIAMAADKRRSAERAAASYNGTAPTILDRIINEVSYEESKDIGTVESNRASKIRQAEYEKTATKSRATMAPLYLTTPSKPLTGISLLSGITKTLTGVGSTMLKN